MKLVTLEFHPASSPPDVDTTVLISNGEDVFCGWYDDTRAEAQWYDSTAATIGNVKAWAHLPDPQECVEEK